MDGVALLTIFVLSIFVGFEVVSKVSTILHTPLMSGANAIHGVILVGAIIVTGHADTDVELWLGLVAVVLATVNMVGGFVVTDRMLQMFTTSEVAGEGCLTREPDVGAAGLPGRCVLLHPGAQGAVVAEVRASRQPARCRRCGHRRGRHPGGRGLRPHDRDPRGDRAGNRVRRPCRPPRADDGDAAARGALQRSRWRRRQRSSRSWSSCPPARRVAPAPWLASVFTVLIGSVSFSGSVITFLKLQGLMTSRPVVFPGMQLLLPLTAVASVGLALGVLGTRSVPMIYVLGAVSLLLGVLFVLPVGRRRRPDRHLAAQRCHRCGRRGVRLRARQRAAAHRRNLGRCQRNAADPADGQGDGATASARRCSVHFSGGSTLGGGEASDRPVKSLGPSDVAVMLAYAERVVIVPGYGLAVAQAQGALKELVDLLGERGIEVSYGIHPVAGRMPGHMNVLLAEANVPYEQLKEMDEINPELPCTDVVLVVGRQRRRQPGCARPREPRSPGCRSSTSTRPSRWSS